VLPVAALPVPAAQMSVLAGLAPLFTVSSFRPFTMLACGFIAKTGQRTVCGMLTGAGLSRSWSHERAHRFFLLRPRMGVWSKESSTSVNGAPGSGSWSWPVRLGSVVVVVEAAGDYGDHVGLDVVHEPVLLGYPARPDFAA
jgi:hypothetical protein